MERWIRARVLGSVLNGERITFPGGVSCELPAHLIAGRVTYDGTVALAQMTPAYSVILNREDAERFGRADPAHASRAA